MTIPPPDRAPGSQRAALLRSARFREHDTGSHPENAGRLVAVDEALHRGGLLPGRPDVPFATASDEALARVHDPRYVGGLRDFAARGGGWLVPSAQRQISIMCTPLLPISPLPVSQNQCHS